MKEQAFVNLKKFNQSKKIAILLPLYHGDKPKAFKLALRSLNFQSLRNNIFLIVDGPIDKSLQQVVEDSNNITQIIKTKNNLGLSKALNNALDHINFDDYDFIARMDADDFSSKYRLENIISHMNNNNLDVCGSDYWIFDQNRGRQYVKMPKNIKQMKKKILIMSPICHPSVVFRSNVLRYERYPENTYFQEDYSFWVNLIEKGYKFGNRSEPLLYFRMTEATSERRIGFRKIFYDVYDRQYAMKIYSGSKIYGYTLIFLKFLVFLIIGKKYRLLLKLRNWV